MFAPQYPSPWPHSFWLSLLRFRLFLQCVVLFDALKLPLSFSSLRLFVFVVVYGLAALLVDVSFALPLVGVQHQQLYGLALPENYSALAGSG